MKILFVGRRDLKHSNSGGYHKIAFMPNAVHVTSERFPGFKIPYGDISHLYRVPLFYRILRRINISLPEIVSHILRWEYDITHLYYGDHLIPFLPYLRSCSHKMVITIHLDLERKGKSKRMFLWNLRRFDGIIVLSSNQQKMLREKYNINSTFIPHGFSIPKFSYKLPVDVQGRFIDKLQINIFVSGSNYRDLVLLSRIIRSQVSNKSIHFHLVGMETAFKERMYLYQNVSIYNRLSDDEYFTLLSCCDYNFLPLYFATANNALLEAEFLGITSILPAIGGIEDYAALAPLNMFYNSFEDLLTLFSFLEKQKAKEEIKLFASKFEWENIYKQLENYYRSLF